MSRGNGHPRSADSAEKPLAELLAERFISSLRRECLDHIIVFNEVSLRHILKAYFDYYEHSQTHLALEKDAPVSRAVEP